MQKHQYCEARGKPIPDIHTWAVLQQCTSMVANWQPNCRYIQSQIHKVFYLWISKDYRPVGWSLILAAAAADVLEAVLSGLVAAEATAQHEEAAATKWREKRMTHHITRTHLFIYQFILFLQLQLHMILGVPVADATARRHQEQMESRSIERAPVSMQFTDQA
jgi:hypothetical protein